MWWKLKGPKRRRLWSSVMAIVMMRFRSEGEVDRLSLFRPNLEVRSPRVAMLIKVWQPESRDGRISALMCL